jgi:hypothetical protein
VVFAAMVAASVVAAPRAEAHLVVCVTFASDSKIDPPNPLGHNYAWYAATVCPKPIEQVGVGGALQKYDFRVWRWGFEARLLGSAPENHWLAVTGGTLYVPPFHGINCRRVHSVHSILHHGQLAVGYNSSGSECY